MAFRGKVVYDFEGIRGIDTTLGTKFFVHHKHVDAFTRRANLFIAKMFLDPRTRFVIITEKIDFAIAIDEELRKMLVNKQVINY
jgi:hypothetical protein